MRTRLTRVQRRADILEKARALFAERGYGGTEMEDIRLACGISRGGLYHHFANRRAILEALVGDEIAALAQVLKDDDSAPISALLRAGSSQLGSDPGVVSSLRTREERLDYLSALEQALAVHLRDPLAQRLREVVRADIDPHHVTELFLTINTHINRRVILGEWTNRESAGFAATALTALGSLFSSPTDLAPVVAELNALAEAP